LSGAYFDVKGESINEERNQEESGREEESCSEEEKVAKRLAIASLKVDGPERSGPFLF
jgi:hypothetical protein